jgi:PhnB protein
LILAGYFFLNYLLFRFDGLSAGGEVEGAIGDSPWGTYAGMFRDKYGIEWIVEFDPGYNG